METKTININRADLKQLQQIKGIGPIRAQMIIDYRANAKFRDMHELSIIRGLGKKTMAVIITEHMTDGIRITV